MDDVRKIVMDMEEAVNHTAELAAALRLCAAANADEGLSDADRRGIYRLADVVQERANSVLTAWHMLDVATGPKREAGDE